MNLTLSPSQDAGKDIQRKTDQLVQDVEDIKHSLTHLQVCSHIITSKILLLLIWCPDPLVSAALASPACW